MLSYRGKGDAESLESALRYLRLIETDKLAYDTWIRRSDKLVYLTKIDSPLLLGAPACFDQFGPELLAVYNESSLDCVCRQFILSAFMTKLASNMSGPVGGVVRARGGRLAAGGSLGMRNASLGKLVSRIERTKLATIEDIF